jgi:hypothetical protein
MEMNMLEVILKRFKFFTVLLFCSVPLFLMSQDVTLDIATTPSTCFANGTITITLKGNDVVHLSQIYYTVVNTTTQVSQSGINNFFENLSKGEYSVTVDAMFQNTTPIQKKGNTTVGGNYSAPAAFKINATGLIGTRKTFNCKNSGRVAIEITGGVFPYIVETYKNSTFLKVDTFKTFQNSGTDRYLPDFKDYYNIDNLSAGNYTFKVKDGCSYGLPEISENVGTVSEDYYSYIFSIAPSSNIFDYNIVNINFGGIWDPDDLYKYYYDQTERNIVWWEYTYSFNGGTEKPWRDIPASWYKVDTVASASKYCDLWNKNYQIKVRVKGCTNIISNTYKVEYSGYIDIHTENIFDPVTGCAEEDKMKLFINFYSSECYFTAPIQYEIKYLPSGTVWYTASVSMRECSWEKKKKKNKIDHNLHILTYDKNNCSLINGNYIIPPPPDNNWIQYANNRLCNTPYDYDYMYWSWNECGNTQDKPPVNTIIELTESPNNQYYHFTATYNRNLNFWNIIKDNSTGFTVSNEGYCEILLQSKDLVSGNYSWKITDGCGRNDIAQTYYEFYTYEIEEPFTFQIQTTCEGKKYLPKVKFVGKRKNDGYKIIKEIGFEVYGVAGGYYPGSGYCNTDCITFSIPGDYQIYFYMDGMDVSCFIPPKSITYDYNGLALLSAYGYACDDGVNKASRVVVEVDSTSGVSPYHFDLYDSNDELIASNYTGIFYNLLPPDCTVTVMITDQCGSSYNQNVKIINLGEGANIAFAENSNVCIGTPIHLHSVTLMGSHIEYQWKGPNNFSSNNKDPIIYNSTLNNQGYYFLTILGLECTVKDSIFIAIIPVDTGYVEDYVCRGTPYTNYGFEIDPLDIADTTYIFFQTGLLTHDFYCDSTVCLFLTVKDFALLSIGSVGEICADAPYFIVPWNFYDEEKYFYNIQFNYNAVKQGFNNIDSGIIVSDNYVEITIPHENDRQNYVMPHNHYTASITVNNGFCNSRILEFPFQVSYPSWIIEQKWNDVIALLNDRYNGGYTFSKYEWFKNGNKLEGENGSYIYYYPALDFGTEYRARLTRDLDGEAFFTCPLIPEYRPGLKVYPQLVSQNEPLFVETQQNGNVDVWNVLGKKVAQFQVFDNQVNKIYLNETGFLFLEIIQNNGYRKTFKIIVN